METIYFAAIDISIPKGNASVYSLATWAQLIHAASKVIGEPMSSSATWQASENAVWNFQQWRSKHRMIYNNFSCITWFSSKIFKELPTPFRIKSKLFSLASKSLCVTTAPASFQLHFLTPSPLSLQGDTLASCQFFKRLLPASWNVVASAWNAVPPALGMSVSFLSFGSQLTLLFKEVFSDHSFQVMFPNFIGVPSWLLPENVSQIIIIYF